MGEAQSRKDSMGYPREFALGHVQRNIVALPVCAPSLPVRREPRERNRHKHVALRPHIIAARKWGWISVKLDVVGLDALGRGRAKRNDGAKIRPIDEFRRHHDNPSDLAHLRRNETAVVTAQDFTLLRVIWERLGRHSRSASLAIYSNVHT